MGCLDDDLERFLRTHGIRILKDALRRQGKPLTVADIAGLGQADLDSLDGDALEDLLDRAEDLRDDLEDRDPEPGDGEARDLREYRLSEVEYFIDRVRYRLREAEQRRACL